MPDIIYVAKLEAPQLWTPPGARLAHDNTAQYMPDLDAWVASNNFLHALRSRLRTYPLDELLALISRTTFLKVGRADDIAEYMRDQNWDQTRSLRIYQLAFVVRVALEDHEDSADRRWPASTDGEKLRLLQVCTEMAQAVVAEVDDPAVERPPGSAWALLHRVANQQFGEFEPLKKFYPRALLLFGECARDEEQRQGITLDAIFEEQTGLGMEEAMFLAFCIYSLLGEGKHGNILEPGFMTGSEDFPWITTDKIAKLCEWLSVDFQGYLEAAKDPKVGSSSGYNTYNFNPLVEYPIIRLPNGNFVVPIAHYLFQRVTTGLFYDFVRSRRHSNRAGNIVGRAIEQYVKRLIVDLPNVGHLVSEVEYERGRRTSEWIVDDQEAVIVIECKRKALLQRAKTTGEAVDLTKALGMKGGVADGLVQLKETEDAIKAGLVPGVDRNKRVIGVLITLDHFYNANGRDTNDILLELVKARRPDGLGDLEYQICPIPDLEEVCRLLNGTNDSLASFFAGKIDGVNDVPFDVPTREWDCGQYTTHIWPEGHTASLPSHESVFEQFVQRIRDRFEEPSVGLAERS